MVMENSRFLKIWVIAIALTMGIMVMVVPMAQAQYLPISYYYTSPLAYPSYGYFNSINGQLLGYAPFTPFLTPSASSAYNLLGIPTYPYVGSPYKTTFPYTTLPGTIIPYARFSYPSYVYGSPSFYQNWVLLQ
jgi:hypothetical protein